jgi:hypothetical protein
MQSSPHATSRRVTHVGDIYVYIYIYIYIFQWRHLPGIILLGGGDLPETGLSGSFSHPQADQHTNSNTDFSKPYRHTSESHRAHLSSTITIFQRARTQAAQQPAAKGYYLPSAEKGGADRRPTPTFTPRKLQRLLGPWPIRDSIHWQSTRWGKRKGARTPAKPKLTGRQTPQSRQPQDTTQAHSINRPVCRPNSITQNINKPAGLSTLGRHTGSLPSHRVCT